MTAQLRGSVVALMSFNAAAPQLVMTKLEILLTKAYLGLNAAAPQPRHDFSNTKKGGDGNGLNAAAPQPRHDGSDVLEGMTDYQGFNAAAPQPRPMHRAPRTVTTYLFQCCGAAASS